MIKLKLAEYEEGKFKRFLELGKDFVYGGNNILTLTNYGPRGRWEAFYGINAKEDAALTLASMRVQEDLIIDRDNIIESLCECVDDREAGGSFEDAAIEIFDLDEKDPLNRFDGLFNGRTFGGGRFVLIESKIIDRFGNKLIMSQDDIFSYNKYYQKACDFINFHHWEETESELETNKTFKVIGNLHEQPELWEKVK